MDAFKELADPTKGISWSSEL